MSVPPPRGIIRMILRNFLNSIKPRQFKGILMGQDYFGNKYFEIPANPSLGSRRSRWFEPLVKDDFQQEMPAEWESWLRGRRKEIPTEEEISKNVAIMQMKKHNAVAIEAKAGKITPMHKGVETYPVRPEYERAPGEKS